MTSGQQAQFLQQFTQLEKAIGQVRTLIDDIAAMNPAVANETNTLMRGVTNGMDGLRKSGLRMAAQVEQFQGLSRTAAMLNSSLEPDEVFEGVMDTIIQLTGAERAFIVLCDGDEMKMQTARNWDLENIPQGDATFSRSIVQATLDAKTPTLTTNAQADTRFQAAQSISANALRSVLCVPLMVRDQPIGVIYTDNRVLAGLFDQDTETLLMTFAHQAAIAIDNARLFERVKADLKEAQKELQVLRVHVNHADLHQQVAEITDTDYFKKLEQMVKQRRDARRESGH